MTTAATRNEMSAPSALYQTATNDDGMASFVYANTRGGFNVTLRDMDAEQTVPVCKMYRDLASAMAAADALVAQ